MDALSIKARIKKKFKRFIDFLSSKVANTYLGDLIITSLLQVSTEVYHKNCRLLFCSANRLMSYRANTFSNKEPETLEWIDAFKEGSVLWDIGANVGLYSIYAAKSKLCKVYAFEPSIFNLEFLARNIVLNKLEGMVAIIPSAVSSTSGVNTLFQTTMEWGGALSTFEKNIGWDGNSINDIFSYKTLGISMDDFVTLAGIDYPDYIKVDVDGLEHYILQGGGNVLKSVKEILIEVNDAFSAQSLGVSSILSSHGFEMVAKKHAESFCGTKFEETYNQIWSRVIG